MKCQSVTLANQSQLLVPERQHTYSICIPYNNLERNRCLNLGHYTTLMLAHTDVHTHIKCALLT
jgi:hypothetical protein